MRNILFKVLLVFITGFLSCNKDDINTEEMFIASCDDGIQNGTETGIDCGGGCARVCPRVNILNGELASWLDLVAGEEYILTGPLLVRDGGVLNINEGVTIKVMHGINAYIAIAQGGRIFVNGKEDNPVVMTSDAVNPAAGDWGGLVICGKAPTNEGVNARSELLDIFYGGSETEDSSGTIKYLRIEYTGAKFENVLPFNGITFYGVGAFTFVNHIQSYNSLGNGIEVNGGTVDLNFILSSNSDISGIKLSEGWSGEGNNWYLSGSGKSGLLLQNNTVDEDINPITSGILSELSIIGPAMESAIKYTNGGGVFTLNEVYTSQFQSGILIQDINESNLIDQGKFQLNIIQFDKPLNNFIPTNYMGSNSSFYEEGNSFGAGSKGNLPDWALGWSIDPNN